MNGRRPAPAIPTVHEFTCGTCERRGPLEQEDFINHLVAQHALARPIRGTRTTTLHLDHSDRYVSVWAWALPGGIEATEYLSAPRHRHGYLGDD